MEQVGNIRIDFNIFSNTPKNLIVADDSDWLYSENLPAYINVTLPGSKKFRTFPFKKEAMNRFNSHLLGLSCLAGNCKEEVFIDLPDGIYTMTLKSGYQDIETTKFYLKTDLFNQEFAKVMIKYGVEYTEEGRMFLEEMMFIKGLITVAQSHAHEGDFIKAQRFFEQAKHNLNKKVNCLQ